MSERATRRIDRLFPEPGPTSIEAELDGYNPTEWVHEDRPYVAVNFATTLDGRASVEGRSGAIGSEIDSAMLMRLRTRFDAVMIGTGTMQAERYGRIVPDPQLRARRERIGLPHDPLAVIVSGSLNLPWDAPLFTSGGGRILIYTTSDSKPPPVATSLRTVRLPAAPTGGIAITDVLHHLRHQRGIRALLCEGGPSLHGQLQAAGAVDELFLTTGPKMAGGDAPRILEGALPSLRDAELVGLLRNQGELLARYRF